MSGTLFAVLGGEARSGKGTSADALGQTLEGFGQEVVSIDQGQKFRLLAELAITHAQPMDDITALKYFIEDEKTQNDVMRLREELKSMDKDEIKEFLYRPAISTGSGQVGKVPTAHTVTIDLLRSEVQEAVNAKADTVIIDGRVMEKYARIFEKEGLGTFAIGWYFRCHADIAARRSIGMYVDHTNMSSEEKGQLLTEIIRISERNRSDAMRDIDPMREPLHAYRLDLAQPDSSKTHHGFAAEAMRNAYMAVVDTSYTRNVPEMLVPVIGLSVNALSLRGGNSLNNTPVHFNVTDLPKEFQPRR